MNERSFSLPLGEGWGGALFSSPFGGGWEGAIIP